MNDRLLFTNDGVLPKGDHKLTLKQLKSSILVKGPLSPMIHDWDVSWRNHLVNQAELLIRQLWEIGVTEIFLNGSFVEAKPHPNDIDGYFECDISEFAQGNVQRELNKLDPFKIWTWDTDSRKTYRNYLKKQLPMWHKYRVELYPHYGQNSGILDKFGHQLLFPAAFRSHRTSFMEKGIIKIVR